MIYLARIKNPKLKRDLLCGFRDAGIRLAQTTEAFEVDWSVSGRPPPAWIRGVRAMTYWVVGYEHSENVPASVLTWASMTFITKSEDEYEYVAHWLHALESKNVDVAVVVYELSGSTDLAVKAVVGEKPAL